MEIAEARNEGNAAADQANDRLREIRVLEKLKQAVNDAYDATTKGTSVSTGPFGVKYKVNNEDIKYCMTKKNLWNSWGLTRVAGRAPEYYDFGYNRNLDDRDMVVNGIKARYVSPSLSKPSYNPLSHAYMFSFL